MHDNIMAAKHIRGAVRIIQSAGGMVALGLSEVVRCILYSCLYGKGFLDWEREELDVIGI